MKIYNLSFATIEVVERNLFEIIVAEGIELNDKQVSELNRLIENISNEAVLLLINRVHSYSYSFEALALIGDIKNLKSVAVVTYTRAAELTSKAIIEFPREFELNLKVFKDRDLALTWLKT